MPFTEEPSLSDRVAQPQLHATAWFELGRQRMGEGGRAPFVRQRERTVVSQSPRQAPWHPPTPAATRLKAESKAA